MEIESLRLGVIAWAQRNGILADNVLVEHGGDHSLAPFNGEMVEFFRTRKIVRVEIGRQRLTIYSRLPIAKTKKAALQRAFEAAYQKKGIRLYVDSSRPFKVDNALQTYGRFEPVRKHGDAICCGSSIGLGNQRNSGTLTALATDENGNFFGLSCNHVIGGCSIAQPGTPIVSPGIQDVSVENNQLIVIGDYARPAQMAQGLPSVTGVHRNRDLACFQVRNAMQLSSLQGSGDSAYDTPTKFTKPKDGMAVKKWGRSTSLTHGEISYIDKSRRPEPIEYNVTCYYGPMNSQVFKGTVYFDEVYEVTPFGKPFSLGGDSGALVVSDQANQKEKVVGIIVAGEKHKSILLPLKPALDELKLSLVAGHNV